MKRLIEKQSAFLAFLREYAAEHGSMPTYAEMMAWMGTTSPNGPRQNLNALRKKGFMGFTKTKRWWFTEKIECCPACGRAYEADYEFERRAA